MSQSVLPASLMARYDAGVSDTEEDNFYSGLLLGELGTSLNNVGDVQAYVFPFLEGLRGVYSTLVTPVPRPLNIAEQRGTYTSGFSIEFLNQEFGQSYLAVMKQPRTRLPSLPARESAHARLIGV